MTAWLLALAGVSVTKELVELFRT